MVTIKADRAGLQLAKFGDVRLNGALVGQVREISQDGEQAVITVALEPRRGRRRSPPTSTVRDPARRRCSARSSSRSCRPTTRRDGAARGRRRHPRRPGRDQRRAEPDPRRPLPAAARGAARRPERHPQRAGHRAGGPRRAARRDPGRARRLPRRDRRRTCRPCARTCQLLADVADTYDLAAPDLLDDARQPHGDQRATVDREAGRARRLLLRPRRPRRHLDPASSRDNEENLIRVGQVHRAGARAARGRTRPSSRACSRAPRRTRRSSSKTFEGDWSSSTSSSAPPVPRLRRSATCPEYGEVGHGPWCSGLPNPPVPGRPGSTSTRARDIDENPPTQLRPGLPAGVRRPDLASSLTQRLRRHRRPSRQVVNALLADAQPAGPPDELRLARLAALRPGRARRRGAAR